MQAAIVLSKDTTFSSSQLRLFTLDESHAPASAKTFNRMLLAVSTDGYVSAKSFKVEGTALSFTQSGSTENIRTIVIPGISYTVK